MTSAAIPEEVSSQRKGRALAALTSAPRPRAFEDVVAKIRAQLESGALAAGDRLPPERQLAEDLRVSRHTVREALRSLENAGVLELRKGATGGAFVRQGNTDVVLAGISDLARLGVIRPEDLREARIIVGSAVARLACKRRTQADLDALRSNVAASEAFDKAGQSRLRTASNFEFHRILARTAKNPLLEVLTEAVLAFNLKLAGVTGQPDFASILLSRRRLLKCLEQRDADGAAREIEAYLTRLQRFYMRRVKALGL